jgi:hypothetical protein
MTREAVTEARKYVEESIESQKLLGYRRSPRPDVVKAAVSETAAAFAALVALNGPKKT